MGLSSFPPCPFFFPFLAADRICKYLGKTSHCGQSKTPSHGVSATPAICRRMFTAERDAAVPRTCQICHVAWPRCRPYLSRCTSATQRALGPERVVTCRRFSAVYPHGEGGARLQKAGRCDTNVFLLDFAALAYLSQRFNPSVYRREITLREFSILCLLSVLE